MNFIEELKRRNVIRVGIAYSLGAWLLLQIIDFVLEVIAAPDWILQVFFLAAIVGLAVALVTAWIFEITPEGIKRETQVDPEQSITLRTSRKLDRTIIIFLTLAVLILLIDKFTGAGEEAKVSNTTETAAEPAPAIAEEVKGLQKSIAVLPFESRSPNPEDEFFADGMHDELLTHLAKISDLLVISRTSVMGYANTERRIPEIAEELGVATIMEGSVQRAGKRVRINVQLIDAVTDAHLWAEIYDRELTAENIFDIQSEITRAIASALNSTLSSDNKLELETSPTQSLAAYDAYIAGRLLFNRLTRSGFEQAIEQLEKAIREDPGFAAAWSSKAEALLELYWLFDIGNLELIEDARVALEQASALAPDTVETKNAYAHYYYYALLDYDRANTAFDRVLERAPNFARAWAGKGFVLRRAGRYEEAIAALESALELDPLALDPLDGIVVTSALIGRFTKAREFLERMKALAPTNENTVTSMASIHYYSGNSALRWSVFDWPIENPGSSYFDARMAAAIGTRDEGNMTLALEDWPGSLRSPERFPELYNLRKAEALLVMGRNKEAELLLSGIKARIDASPNPYPHGWAANAWYLPVDLPGLMADLDMVNDVVAAYEAEKPADIFSRHGTHYPEIAKAYARAGDDESALDYLEKTIEAIGPMRYLPISIEPAFDGLRNHPRYLAMQSGYQAWSAMQQ